jgi:divalent metal cation (Fe/Co/Zn/Cd) transporter
VVGVIGVWLGFERADAIIGLIIGVVVFGILISTMRTVSRRLMDGVEPGIVEKMRATAAEVDGVLAVDRVRARWCGHRLEADADVAVSGGLSVMDGHGVAERVEHELLHAAPHLESVVVHLHPVVDGERPDGLHELSGHHVSVEARAAYREKLAMRGQ